MLGGTEENSVLPRRGVIVLPSRQISDYFYQKRNDKKIELVVGPDAADGDLDGGRHGEDLSQAVLAVVVVLVKRVEHVPLGQQILLQKKQGILEQAF